MTVNENDTPSGNLGSFAEEVFNEYFKKSQSVIGTLNPNIFWQLYEEKEAENPGPIGPIVPSKDDPSPEQ